MTRTLRSILLLVLLLLAATLAAQDRTPDQMIIKTTQPRQITRGALGLPTLDSFLRQQGLVGIKPMRPMQDERWFVASFAQPLDWTALQEQRLSFAGVEYIQPNYLNRFYATPNDPYFINQQFDLVNLPEAWDITTGSNEVLVAVVDSGLFFDHPDLQQHIYYNPGEIPDNGIDDDGNGYVDDWRGWDFADAPELADIALGDYLDEDNDATDENRHGTHVSGIICADANNNTGICGAMWNMKLLVCRAGFRTTQGTGYLQDDDVAAAIMYAADMGADVVNMSWGDTNYSQVVDDACRYAYDKGTILVASAGNDASAGISYPAHLSTTIAVGGVNSYLGAAGYSTGPEMDVVAPGAAVLSCWDPETAEQYSEQSGTSMAAPFVTGIVGLLLSYDPGLNFEQIRARLASTATDLGDEGFDNTFGWGLVNAQALLNADSQPVMTVDYPADNIGVSSSFDIVGSADCTGFFRYNIMYTTEEAPQAQDWKDVVNHTNTPTFYYDHVSNGVLGRFEFEPYQSDGSYELRVQMTDETGQSYEVHRNFYIDQTPPVLADSLLKVYRRYDEELARYYIEAKYDEPVSMHAMCLAADGHTYDVYSDYADSILVVALPQTMPQGLVDLKLEAQNRSGLVSVSPWYTRMAYIRHTSVDVSSYEQDLVGTALLCLPPHAARTFVGMELDESYGPVHFYRLQGTTLISLYEFSSHFKPLATGHTKETGMDVLGINLEQALLFDSSSEDGYPALLQFTINSALGGTLADYDQDGKDEIILVRNLATARAITFYQRQYNELTAELDLYNPTPSDSRNELVPTVVMDNLDRDDTPDLLAADKDGDVMVFELDQHGISPTLLWAARLPVPNAYYLATGDFDGDRNQEFCAGGYLQDETDLNKNYWFFGFFRPDGQGGFAMYDWLMFDSVEGQNAITVGNIDDDDADELLFALSPNVYLIDQVDGVMTPVWKGSGERSFQPIIFPQDGHTDMAALVNIEDDGDHLRSYVITASEPFTGPPTPQGFHVEPTGYNSVGLHWMQEDERSYRVYRRLQSETDGTLIATELGDTYTDTHLTTGQTYEYAITALDDDYTPNESLTTLWKEATPNYAPTLVSIEATSANRLELVFDRALSSSAQNTGHYEVDQEVGRPLSSILTGADSRLVLTFGSVFPTEGQTYNLHVKDLTGDTGVPFIDQDIAFLYGGDFTPPEVMAVTPNEQGTLEIEFSEYLAYTAQDTACYKLLPPPVDSENHVASVSFANDRVTLTFASPLQVSNQPYYLKLNGITDMAGNAMRNDDDRLRFSLATIRNLDYVKIAPNPLYLPNAQNIEEVRFFDLPLGQSGKLTIYNLSGELVYSQPIEPLSETQYFVGWNARNHISKPVSSGSYFYILEMNGSYKKGTISIVR